MDTASDYGLLVQWYHLMIAQQSNPETVEPNLDMLAMFVAAASFLGLYRLYSAYKIYQMTRSCSDFIYQFIFDFGLLKAMYVNVVKMHSFELLEFTKAFRSMEGMTESFPQAVLALVFLLKTENNNNFIAWFSFILSMYSIISRVMTADNPCFIDTWKELNMTATNIIKCNWWFAVNYCYLFRLLYRVCDVGGSVLLHALCWYVFGALPFI